MRDVFQEKQVDENMQFFAQAEPTKKIEKVVGSYVFVTNLLL